MNLILLEPSEVDDAGRVQLTGERARHVRQVLKAVPGQVLQVGLVDGDRGQGVVETVAEDTVGVRCTFHSAPAVAPPVDLLLALPRPKVLKRLWSQLAAMGVGRIILTNAAKVERNYFDTHVLAPDFFRPRLVEGLQQARDTRLPEVLLRRQLKVLVEDELDGLYPDDTRLLADVGVTGGFRTALQATTGRVLLAVGPEGGWTDYERDLFQRHRFGRVGLGARALRSDTACLALLALVYDALQERDAG